jgi:hypothetical protein
VEVVAIGATESAAALGFACSRAGVVFGSLQ